MLIAFASSSIHLSFPFTPTPATSPSLPLKRHVGLHEVVLDALAFRERSIHRLPSALNLHSLTNRPVQSFNSVVVCVRLSHSRPADMLGFLVERVLHRDCRCSLGDQRNPGGMSRLGAQLDGFLEEPPGGPAGGGVEGVDADYDREVVDGVSQEETHPRREGPHDRPHRVGVRHRGL